LLQIGDYEPYKVKFETYGHNFFKLENYGYPLVKYAAVQNDIEVWRLNTTGQGWKHIDWDETIRFNFDSIIILKVWGAKTPFDLPPITGLEDN
jgi:hypothetical protein